VIEAEAVAAEPAASVTLTVNPLLPASVGVPVTRQSLLNVSPAGSVPLTRAQLYGVRPSFGVQPPV
jgi:hypothetical protein